jgi:hypothetical protein
MRRHSVVSATAVVVGMAVACASGASAATHKKPVKTKKVGGSYNVTAVPDPTMDATAQAGMECFNVDPASVDNHPLALPGTGLLKIVLDSSDPTSNKMDWDLHLLDAKGDIISSSNGPTAHEEIDQPGARGKVTIRACNIAGEPTATIKWTFTYH